MSESTLITFPVVIDKNTTGVTGPNSIATQGSSSERWVQFMQLVVPLGVAYRITPSNYLFLKCQVNPGVLVTTGQARVLKENVTGSQTIELWSGPLSIFKDIGDTFQRPYARTVITLGSSEKLSVQILGNRNTITGAISDFYFDAEQFTQAIY